MEEYKANPTDENQTPHNETISELARKHLLDPTHTTSEEELRNARIEYSDPPPVNELDEMFQIDNETVIPPIDGEPEITDDNESDEKDIEDTPPNPYDVLR